MFFTSFIISSSVTDFRNNVSSTLSDKYLVKTSLLLGILFARDGSTLKKIIETTPVFAIFLLPVIVAPLLLNSARYVVPLVFFLLHYLVFSMFLLCFPCCFLKVLCSVVFHNNLVCLPVCFYIFCIFIH